MCTMGFSWSRSADFASVGRNARFGVTGLHSCSFIAGKSNTVSRAWWLAILYFAYGGRLAMEAQFKRRFMEASE
jgi:hypothetical protein